MLQLLQSLSTGQTDLVELPVPRASGSELLIEGRCSLVSAGTERMLVEFGRAGWLQKARSQPDKIAQVVNKIRTDGLGPTIEAVRSKLETPIPLGYCHAGVIAEVGRGASGFAVGDRVVSNGPHAEWVTVPWTLAARIPDGVSFEAASFTPLAAIALQGLRLAAPELGEVVVVYGLGLIGLLAVQLLRANGCRVLGIDTNAERLALAKQFGAEPVAAAGDAATGVSDLTGGVGADAVLLTLASASDDPVHHAALMCRKRGRIVLVGVTGLNLRRDDFYKKELQFAVSCSYGPGRYDPEYEDVGRDYPLPFVRWTAQRNFDAVLQLIAARTVDPLALLTHRFAFRDARRAYDLIVSSAPSLGVVLTYDRRGPAIESRREPTLEIQPEPRSDAPSSFCVGVIGAGNFGTRVLIPGLAAVGARLRTIASSRGTSAAVAARRFGFERVTADVQEMLADDVVDTVVILTRHNTHGSLALRALEAGKHVFVEKPLALIESDLDRVERARVAADRVLTVGFNRRFARLAGFLCAELQRRSGPAALILTVNAGTVAGDHWTQVPEIGGGRIVGEACHFIDLARFLVGAPIRDVAVTAAAARDGRPVDDITHLSLRFDDGSTAVVHYLANGSSAFPKERIEAFADGRIWRIDNWRRLASFGGGRGRGHRFSRMDKGHRAELASLARAVRIGGAPPIPYAELFEVSRWAIRAAHLARGDAQRT